MMSGAALARRNSGVTRLGVAAGAAVGVLTMASALPASIPGYADADGVPVPGSIAEMVTVEINGFDQWLVIRGRDTDKPVLLFLHGGPGTPETPFLEAFNRDLADHFVVVAWEQRGAGKSFAPRPPAETMTIGQLVSDTHQVIEHLKGRFGRDRIYVVGHSWGTVLAMEVAARHPDDVQAVVSISQTSDAMREQKLTYEWVRGRATDEENGRALRRIEPIGARLDEPLSLEDTSTLLSLVDEYGGGAFHGQRGFRKLVWTVLTSRVYTLGEKIDYLRGERFSLEHLYPELSRLNLFEEVPEVEVPVYFIHGRHDYQVPMEVAHDYYLHLQAPFKRFVVFEESAHGVLFEEPDHFLEVMRTVVLDAPSMGGTVPEW